MISPTVSPNSISRHMSNKSHIIRSMLTSQINSYGTKSSFLRCKISTMKSWALETNIVSLSHPMLPTRSTWWKPSSPILRRSDPNLSQLTLTLNQSEPIQTVSFLSQGINITKTHPNRRILDFQTSKTSFGGNTHRILKYWVWSLIM